MSKPNILYIYPGARRAARIFDARNGAAPREFFYGLLELQERGYSVEIGDSHADPASAWGGAFMKMEILRNRLTRVGWSKARVTAVSESLRNTDMAISFTDGFSLAMGLSAARQPAGLHIIGGFMGLSDMTERARPLLRGHVERTIRKSLDGLNHIFFFGEADRKQAILRYGLDQARTSVFQFGIDTEFWCTKLSSAKTSKILAVGSDPSRDYDTLLKAETSWPLQILTRLPVLVPEGRQNVNIVYGSMPASALTDIELRDLYRSAAIVAVPLKDVWQPSGQSVTMQAMACGCPVVLTRGRGLWDPAVFVDGENCLLVPPGDASAWTQALGRLAQDPDLRERIGEAARRTVETHFALDRMNASATALVQNNWER